MQFCTARKPRFNRIALFRRMEYDNFSVSQVTNADMAAIKFARVTMGPKRGVLG